MIQKIYLRISCWWWYRVKAWWYGNGKRDATRYAQDLIDGKSPFTGYFPKGGYCIYRTLDVRGQIEGEGILKTILKEKPHEE